MKNFPPVKYHGWHRGSPRQSETSGSLSFPAFWLTVSLVYALVFVSVEFADSPVSGLRGALTIAAQWGVVSASAAMVIGALAVSSQVFAVAFPVLTVASTIAAYFRITMGLSLTPTLIELTAVNDWATRLSVVSWPLVIAVLVALALALAVVRVRFRGVRAPRYPLVWLVVFVLGAVAPVRWISRFRDPVSARIPYSFYASVKGWLESREAIAELRTTYNNTPVTCSDDAPDVVLVIGESLRPDHLQLNGYPRPTTPRLSADSGVVSFPRVTTEWTYTHVSVPRIMTRQDPEESPYKSQSFITLMNRAGYRSAWLSNQDQVDSYAYFMHEADTLVQCNAAMNTYVFDKWLDSDLLPHFERLLGDRQEDKKLIVIHSIGSHWWYPSHYPDTLARFRPEVDSRIVSELTREQMVNSYDNTVVATDDFLAGLIARLRGRNAVLIYVSDHGEALGEDGNYLHAGDYPATHHVACLVWTSEEFTRRYPGKVEALKRNAGEEFTTETIFHTVLEGAGIVTPVSQPEKSLFKTY